MDKFYILIIRSNTNIGRFIRLMTGYNYSHVSISLNDDLVPLYSFARYYVNRPFTGGFTEESWLRYLDKEKDIKFIKFTIPISKKGKKALAKKLNEMNVHKKYYRYSLLSAINCFYPKMPFCPKNKYTCLSFAVKILKDYGIIDPLITIYEIRKLHYLLKHFPHQVYRMSCSEKQNYEWGLDEYYNRQSILNHLPFVK